MNCRGSSLVEVCVAVGLLALLVLFGLRPLETMARASNQALLEQHLTNLGSQLLDVAVADPGAIPPTGTLDVIVRQSRNRSTLKFTYTITRQDIDPGLELCKVEVREVGTGLSREVDLEYPK